MHLKLGIDVNFMAGFLCACAIIYTHNMYNHKIEHKSSEKTENEGDKYAVLKIITPSSDEDLTREMFNNILSTLLEEIYLALNCKPVSTLDVNVMLRKYVRSIKITIANGDGIMNTNPIKTRMSIVNMCISSSSFVSVLDRVSIMSSEYIYTVGKSKTFTIETVLLKQGVEEFS